MIKAPFTDPDTGCVAPEAIVRISNVKGSLDSEPLIVIYDIYFSEDAFRSGKKPIRQNLQLTVTPESILTNWVPALKTQGYNELTPLFQGAIQID